MGLSSKQVSSDGLDWSQNLLQELPKGPPPLRRQQQQNQQQQSEPLKCPRCDSANTKFCYYNNYNKSQPRHFCRACKRHWTKGGTLRNVPVGGGRKNKRIKKSTAAAPSATTSTSTSNTLLAIQGQQQQRQSLPVSLGDQRCMSEILYQSLLHPPSSLPQKNLINSANNNNNCLGSTLPHLPLDQTLQFPFSSSSSFNTNPLFSVSASFPSSNVYNYSEEINTKEAQEPTITTSSSTATQPWQIPTTTTTTGMDMSTYWNWEDMDPFASTDLNLPWDDSEIKP